MNESLARGRRVAIFIARIANCEPSDLEVHESDGDSRVVIEWHVLRQSPVFGRILVWTDKAQFIARGQVLEPDAGYQTIGTGPVASTVHTDDEIARKIVVNALNFLNALRSMASEEGIDEAVSMMTNRLNRIAHGLQSWGAGMTAEYRGPSPHLAEVEAATSPITTRPTLPVLLIAAAIALIGALDMPYGYYQFLRWALTITGVYIIYASIRNGVAAWSTFGIALLVLFLPAVLVILPASIWKPIDVVVAVLLVCAGFSIKRTEH